MKTGNALQESYKKIIELIRRTASTCSASKAAESPLGRVDSFFAGRMIESALKDRRPFLAGRLGWLECYSLGSKLCGENVNKSLMEKLRRHAGVFPSDEKTFHYFCEVYLDAFKQVDLLALMDCPFESKIIQRYCSGAVRCKLGGLEPFLSDSPWSRSLTDLKVLVIHAFADSIERQYREKRDRLFADSRVLPEFELLCLKAPQTMLNETAGYASWQEALESLKKKTAATEFDVAIVGCGAYGLPIGAHVKSMGKIAVHLGGATQLLFGISGRRWRENPEFQSIMRDGWTVPSIHERPAGWQEIESGCYW